MDELFAAIQQGIPEVVRAYGLWVGCILGIIPGLMGAVPELAQMRKTRQGVGATVVYWFDCLAGAVWALTVWLALGIFIAFAVGSFIVGLWPYSTIVTVVIVGLVMIINHIYNKRSRTMR